MDPREVFTKTLERKETNPDVLYFDSELARLRDEVKKLEDADKAVTTKGEGFRVKEKGVLQDNPMEANILNLENEIRKVEKDKMVFIHEEKIKELEKENEVLSDKKKKALQPLRDEIKEEEQKYHDRITGVSGFRDKTKPDPIEEKILEKEAEIRATEKSFDFEINKNRAVIEEIKNKIESIKVHAQEAASETAVKEEIEAEEQSTILPNEESSEKIEATGVDETGSFEEPEKQAGVEIEKEDESLNEQMESPVNAIEEVSESNLVRVASEASQENAAEKERLAEITAERKREMEQAREIYYNALESKRMQYANIYRGLFNKNEGQVEAALAADSELAELKRDYEEKKRRYREACKNEALHGLEGERLENERKAQDLLLTMEVYDDDTEYRGTRLETSRTMVEVDPRRQNWFSVQFEKARRFFDRIPSIAKQALVGALVLGAVLMSASNLSDVEKSKNAPNKAPTIAAQQVESSKVKKVEATRVKDSSDKRVVDVDEARGDEASPSPALDKKKEVVKAGATVVDEFEKARSWNDASIVEKFNNLKALNSQYAQLVEVARKNEDGDPNLAMEARSGMFRADEARKKLRLDIVEDIKKSHNDLVYKMFDRDLSSLRNFSNISVQEALDGNGHNYLSYLSENAQQFIKKEAKKTPPLGNETFSKWTQRIEMSKWDLELLKAR